MLDDILERTDVSLDRARALLKAARDPGFGSSQPEAAPAPAAAPVAGGYRALCGWLTILPLHLGLSTQPFRLAHANVIRGLGCAEQPAALLASAAGPVANDKCRIALWQDEMVRCAAEAKFWKIVAKQHLVLSWSARGMCQNHTWQCAAAAMKSIGMDHCRCESRRKSRQEQLPGSAHGLQHGPAPTGLLPSTCGQQQ